MFYVIHLRFYAAMSPSISVYKSFSDKPDFEYICPECNVGYLVPDLTTFNVVEPQHSKAAQECEAWDPDWIVYRFTVTCVCNRNECGEVAIVSGSGRVDQRYGDRGESEYYDQFSIKSFFPAPRLFQIPAETPELVETLLDKSFSLYWADVSAASNALRASLEELLNALNIPSQEKNRKGDTVRMSLHRRLEVWSDKEKEYADLCFALKEVGNLGSHGEEVKTRHYLGTLEIYAHVLRELFENNSKKMKELAQSIRDEIKAKQRSKRPDLRADI
ncbi:hypothetical protein LP7551_05405 [Roseibium album]|nr:hypothetical protein LP7551_05405 [Roseibium album]